MRISNRASYAHAGFADEVLTIIPLFVPDPDDAVRTKINDATGCCDLRIKARPVLDSSQSRNYGKCRMFH